MFCLPRELELALFEGGFKSDNGGSIYGGFVRSSNGLILIEQGFHVLYR